MLEPVCPRNTCGTGKRSMTKNSTVMVHEGSAFESGKTSDVLKGGPPQKITI